MDSLFVQSVILLALPVEEPVPEDAYLVQQLVHSSTLQLPFQSSTLELQQAQLLHQTQIPVPVKLVPQDTVLLEDTVSLVHPIASHAVKTFVQPVTQIMQSNQMEHAL